MVRSLASILALSSILYCGCSGGSGHSGMQPDTIRADAPMPADSAAGDSLHPDSTMPARVDEHPAGEPAGAILAPPDSMHALYVNRWAAMGKKWNQFIEMGKTTEINALVVDVKDDRGLTLYPSDVQVAKDINAADGHCMSKQRVRQYLDSMQKYKIYAIARIVVVKDPLLALGKPDWAIRSKADSTKPFTDRKGKHWLDPHHQEVWQYAVDLAKEAVALGFDEIQFDYMRFPDEPSMKTKAIFPLAAGRTRPQVIRQMLDTSGKQIRALGVRFTGDVFGLTTTAQGDMGIGQLWEMFADKLDVIMPMAYPSHYARGSYGISYPNAEPYKTIYHSMSGAIKRSAKVEKPGMITPWYQDFTLGSPHYTAHEVREQIRAGESLGLKGWVLWNPRSVYNIAAFRKKTKTVTESAEEATAIVRK